MFVSNPKHLGIFMIVLGLWLLPLTWTIYMKYEKDKKNETGSAVPVAIYLGASVIVFIVWLWNKHRHSLNNMFYRDGGGYPFEDEFSQAALNREVRFADTNT